MPGSQEWRNCAASQISQQLPDDTADTLAVLDRRAVDRHIWPKAEYERAVELINRGYDKLIVAQIIDRTVKELNNKLHYEQMEESKRQQRHERINELRKRAPSSTPDGPRKNYRIPARAADHTPAIVFEERKAGGRVSRSDIGVFRRSAAGLQPARSQRQGLNRPRPQDPASPNQPVPSSPSYRLLSTRLTPFSSPSDRAMPLRSPRLSRPCSWRTRKRICLRSKKCSETPAAASI